MNLTKKIGATVSALVLGLSLAACGSDAEPSTGADGATEDLGTINLGFVASWTDGLSTAYLLDNQLTKMGYTVEMDEIGDAALIYAALSKGDVDMYPSAWPEVTHADYMNTYGDKIDDIGTYYDNAQLTWAVPEYMDDVNSIEDLKGMGAEFGGKVIGIEPGAGLTKASLENVLPEYELKDEYFWANSEFAMRDLEDPKGALGGAEGLHFLGKSGFADEYPEAAAWISELKLDDDQYGSLEDTVVNQYDEGQEAEAVSAWIEENPDVLPEIKN